jgi:putative acetyltransferase
MRVCAIERVGDAQRLAQFHALLIEYENFLPADLRHGASPDLNRARAMSSDPNAGFLASVEGEPAGCVVLTRLDARTAIVQRLFVKPRYRGHGAARSLVLAALDFARERNLDRVVLDTERDRLPEAYRLYLSLGFHDCDSCYDAVGYANPTFMELTLHDDDCKTPTQNGTS